LVTTRSPTTAVVKPAPWK